MLIPGIWTAMYVEDSLPTALRKLHASGWTWFECSTEHLEMIDQDPRPRERVAEAKETLEELGLSMPQAHALLSANVAHPDLSRRQADMEVLRRHLELSAALGVKTVVIHPGSMEITTPEDMRRVRDANVESFAPLADLAGELGLKIGIENMPQSRKPDVRRFGVTPDQLIDLLDALDHPALGITLDTDHIQASRLDMVDTIRQFGSRICATHMSDANAGALSHRTPGTATIDWLRTIAALRETGYSGIFNLEIPGERHPLPGMVALKVRHAYEITTWLLTKA
jgi:D-psicose/D-tagatose/L-ribulose 3-epimerase